MPTYEDVIDEVLRVARLFSEITPAEFHLLLDGEVDPPSSDSENSDTEEKDAKEDIVVVEKKESKVGSGTACVSPSLEHYETKEDISALSLCLHSLSSVAACKKAFDLYTREHPLSIPTGHWALFLENETAPHKTADTEEKCLEGIQSSTPHYCAQYMR
jgi:hypothetical protein